MNVKKISLSYLGVTEYVRRCSDCPLFVDADPAPCRCRLEPDVRIPDGGIPNDCPLLTLKIHIEAQP